MMQLDTRKLRRVLVPYVMCFALTGCVTETQNGSGSTFTFEW